MATATGTIRRITAPPQLQPDQHLVICVSGGKDSTALALAILEAKRDGLPNPFTLAFCDTGHEHPLTIAHLDYLEERLGRVLDPDALAPPRVPITHVQPPRSWIELAESRGRFPSTKARFCTEDLKVRPLAEWVNAGVDAGELHNPVIVQGIRADESARRATLPLWQDENNWAGKNFYQVPIWRPIREWSAGDTFALQERYSVAPNPLYKMGARRVGCWPCIMSSRGDLKACFTADPGLLDRLREYEQRVCRASKRGISSIFARDKTPPEFHDRTDPDTGLTFPTIDAVYRWVMGNPNQGTLFDEDDGEAPSCWSVYGLCE